MTTNRIFGVALLAMLFGACSSDSTTQPVATGAFTVGTTFSILDSTSGVTNRTETFTYTVVKANGDTLGVLQNGTTDTVLYRMQSNGDFYMYPQPSLSRNDWFLMPFGRQAQITYGPETTQSGGTNVKTTTTAVGEGSGSYTVAGKSYDTKKVKVTVTQEISGATDSTVTHWAYAPSLGFWVSQDEETQVFLGAPQDADHKRLIGITRK